MQHHTWICKANRSALNNRRSRHRNNLGSLWISIILNEHYTPPPRTNCQMSYFQWFVMFGDLLPVIQIGRTSHLHNLAWRIETIHPPHTHTYVKCCSCIVLQCIAICWVVNVHNLAWRLDPPPNPQKKRQMSSWIVLQCVAMCCSHKTWKDFDNRAPTIWTHKNQKSIPLEWMQDIAVCCRCVAVLCKVLQ